MNRMNFIKSIVLGGILLSFLIFPLSAFGDTKEELEAQLKGIEAQIAQYEKDLKAATGEKNTLANKIAQLKKEQSKISLQIQATSLEVNKLGQELTTTESTIGAATQKLALSQQQIATILRELYQQQERSLTHVLLKEEALSDFFGEVQSLGKANQELTIILQETKAVKAELERKHAELEEQRTQKKDLLSVQALQQAQLAAKTSEQNKLLQVTKGKEATYQATLADAKKRAAEIRGRIYELTGVAKQTTTFGEAVAIAQWVSGKTGVRPALLLAVLTQESNLGKNVGTCNRAGDPPSKSYKVVMKPDRDIQPFLETTRELGLDPDITPVSCPMKDAKGNQMGWGGAMGPAQFIPSTWKGYKARVSAITGKPANPWDIRDAFVAAALLLKNNGAVAGNENAEWKAAMIYFSGGTNVKYRFYGDNVLALARKYEQDIKDLNP